MGRTFCILSMLALVAVSFMPVQPAGADDSANYAPSAPAKSQPADGAGETPVVLAVPGTVAYQGYLVDGGGNPINGNVNLQFDIFNVPAAGASLWTETQLGVLVAQGIFQVSLGSVTAFPANLFSTTPRYLAIRINGGAELTPRTQLRSTPYAIQAGNADLVGGEAGPFVNVSGDVVTGVLRLEGGVAGQLGGVSEVVNSTTDVVLRHYFLDNTTTTESWNQVNGRVILSFNGGGTPDGGGAGVATVSLGGVVAATINIPSGGLRPWTTAVDLELTGDLSTSTIDVAVRANSAGSPVHVRSITLETQADRNPWIVVDLNGTILRQSGGFVVTKGAVGSYNVDHPGIDESTVGVVATSFNRPGGGTSNCVVTIFANDATGFNVNVDDLAGASLDHDFSLMCTITDSPATLGAPIGSWGPDNE